MNNITTQEKKTQIESKIIEIAKKMIEDRIDLIEGCRKITSLQYKLNNSDDAFLFLRGIASETDDIPIGKQRDTWASKSIAKLDLEKEEYFIKVKNQILNACKRIIKILSSN